ncbi:hypothetical protein [Pseudoalteromonas sp. MMG022]|uniref:hypothetical protein n=1 Tax=Pseudoalteromonas sp. MMG022 TaxID=2909978 RepID=UPI001F1CEEF6|nr:hypothetical protein [Pseudoalteromonas sp. MMG022]MCF6436767.1 hypothetical protein [Pseudoalteromonas sp. MMG022]
MSNSFKALFVSIVATILSSCSSSQYGEVVAHQTTNKTVQTDSVDGKIQLMLRGFLDSGYGLDSSYAYYSYLIITEKSPDNFGKRLAAATAFMCEFSDVSKASDMELPPHELAIFLAPINSGTNTSKLKQSRSGEELLYVYNYDHSRTIAKAIKRVEPDSTLNIAIVSYPRPLHYPHTNFNHISREALYVVELSGTPPAQIRKVIEKFRRSVTGSKAKQVSIVTEWDANTGEIITSETANVPNINSVVYTSWADRMRVVFASLGAFMNSVVPTAQASTMECQ